MKTIGQVTTIIIKKAEDLIMMTLALAPQVTEEKITLEELADELTMLVWQQGKENWTITEDFSGTKKRSLITSSLSLEFEDNYVMISDHEDLILQNQLVCMMFATSTIQNIIKQAIGDQTTFIITLEDGSITIQ